MMKSSKKYWAAKAAQGEHDKQIRNSIDLTAWLDLTDKLDRYERSLKHVKCAWGDVASMNAVDRDRKHVREARSALANAERAYEYAQVEVFDTAMCLASEYCNRLIHWN